MGLPRPIPRDAAAQRHRDGVGVDRRTAIVAGLGVLAGLTLSRRGLAVPWGSGQGPPVGDPILRLGSLGPSEIIGGLPTSPAWYGDVFAADAIPFHACESCDGAVPEIDEHVDVIVVGAGLAGLAAAHALRHRNAVLMDLRPRVGGNAMGESWRALKWTQGSAYFMKPVRGTSLDALYRELGVDGDVREDASPTTFAWDGKVTTDLLGSRPTDEERKGLERYVAAVSRYADRDYPEIPFDGRPGASVVELDEVPFRTHVESVCGTVPPRLAYALQAYCASSFGVSSDEISAAAGWNFVAAEEGGRWVMPGGNAGLARAFWRALNEPAGGHGGGGHGGGGHGGGDGGGGHGGGGHGGGGHGGGGHDGGDGGRPAGVSVRVNAIVTELERAADGIIVRWRQSDGRTRRAHARHVVCAAPKHVVRHLIPWLAQEDEAKLYAIDQVQTVPYIVGNVILAGQVPHDMYDLFVAGSPRFPSDANAFEAGPIITDIVNGSFAAHGHAPMSVLTAYWPLPWHTARFQVVAPDAWRAWAERAGRQLAECLATIGLRASDVAQVRWTRWGHAMPIAPPGWYVSGAAQLLRRPLLDRVWFANQDNWLLPAVETSLLEGLEAAARIDAALG